MHPYTEAIIDQGWFMLRYLYCAIYLFPFFLSVTGLAEDAHSLLTEPPAEPPAEPSTERFFYEFLRMMGMLGILLALLLLVSWFLKRMLNTRMEQINSSSPIKILDRRTLSPKTVLFVLDVHGKKCIIAESHNGVTYLGDITQDENKQRSFGDVLNKTS